MGVILLYEPKYLRVNMYGQKVYMLNVSDKMSSVKNQCKNVNGMYACSWLTVIGSV